MSTICFTCSFAVDVLLALGLIILLLYWWQTRNHSYWKERHVPYIEPHWFFGSIKDEVQRKNTWHKLFEKCYHLFKENGFGGIYIMRTPAVVVCDPDLLDNILVQDFTHFHDRLNIDCDESLLKNLFVTTGEKWRRMRLKLVSGFSSQKVKNMFDQILNSSNNVVLQIQNRGKHNSLEVENLAFEFSTEAIASCTFGVQLLSDINEEKRFKEILSIMFRNTTYKCTVQFYKILYPKLAKLIGLKMIDVEVTEYFLNLTRNTIKYRKENQIVRNDFLQMIISLKEQEEDDNDASKLYSVSESKTTFENHNASLNCKTQCEKLFTEDTVASLLASLLSTGIVPTVTTINFALFEIAMNPHVQMKLHEEISSAISKFKGLTYEAIKDMPYLDQVIQETLRLHPYAAIINRTVTQTYKIPHVNVTLDKGLFVYIPVPAIHRDPSNYPSPEDFKPERFAGNNYKPSSIFMPFGLGPRMCTSIKFAVMMVKVCLARILSEFYIRVDRKTPIPLVYDENAFFLKVKGGIWLHFENRQSLCST